jgi:hypothetical protein
MKRYLLSVCYPAGATQPPPKELERIMRDVNAIHEDMQKQGVWVFGGGLSDHSTATVLRMQGGEILMTDGPFIESKEQIGGFSIVTAPDLDSAMGWARRLTQAIGVPIEVRAFMGVH